MREIVSPLDGFASPFGAQRGFNPLRIFANDEPGTWFEADDSTTLFTDVAGTTPVTAPGDAVALQLDKSQGLTLGPELVTNGGFDTDTDWTLSGTASISAGQLTLAAASDDARQTTSVSAGRSYEITVVRGGTAIVVCYLGTLSSGGLSSFQMNTAGTFTFILNAASANAGLVRLAHVGGSGTFATIDNISVRELPGNHRTQATTAARPLYALHPVGGVRNKLQYTEEFDNAVWTKLNATVTANATTAPDGTTTAEKLITNSGANYSTSYLQQVVSAGSEIAYTYTVYAKAAELDYVLITLERASDASGYYFNLSTGVVGSRFGATGTAEIEDVGGGWYRCSFTKTSSASTADYFVRIYATPTDPLSGTGDGTSGLFVWGAQLEQSSTATNYQRVGSFLDVSEEGKARRGRIWYNGTSHFMQTGTITPGTDKVQVFAGVRRNSDVNDGSEMLLELSADIASNAGSFFMAANGAAPYDWAVRSRGTTASSAFQEAQANGVNLTSINTALLDISADSTILRIDGVQAGEATGDQGAGNYLGRPHRLSASNGEKAVLLRYSHAGTALSLSPRFGIRGQYLDVSC